MTLLWSRTRLLAAPLVFLLCALGLGRPVQATLGYEISLAHPEQHLFQVTMTIPDVGDEVTLQMPAWNALYQIRDFSGHIQHFEAFALNNRIFAEKLDKETWRVKGHGTIIIRYSTYWDESGPFSTQLNGEHASINPAMVLMYVPSRRGEDVRLSIVNIPDGWQAASASIVAQQSAHPTIFSSVAISYDALVDAPIEVGRFERFQLPGVSPEIWVVVHGDNWKRPHVESELTRICRYELKLMEGAPFENYTFLLHFGKAATGAGGGMEHSNSTTISVSSDDYLANVAAHEFFHLWNVKRIRPASLEPVDHTKEQYTRALWFAEGVTSTYAAYTLVRSGVWSTSRFYGDLSDQISELESRPANHWQSAEQSSLDAWLEKYALYNRPEYSISYYAKGQVLGVLLDILIRDRTDNTRSLDDVLRAMNTDFAKAGKTYRDSLDVRLTAERIAGKSFSDFFDKYVAAPQSLPYEAIFSLAGLHLHSVERKRAALGFVAERDSNGSLGVLSVDSEGPSAAAINVGDVIVLWNGKAPPRSPEWWLEAQHPGDRLRMLVRRGDKELNINLRLGEVSQVLYKVEEEPHANEKARRIREGLLHGEPGAVVAAH
ncbi:MAG: PDZ domain-containing protein [Candidatus Acidiferrum sp.]